MDHGYLTIDNGIHSPFQWVFESASARNSFSGFTENDLYKLCLQLNDNSIWMLIEGNNWKLIVNPQEEQQIFTNVGDGSGLIIKDQIDNVVKFKSIAAGENIEITQDSNSVYISSNEVSGSLFSMASRPILTGNSYYHYLTFSTTGASGGAEVANRQVIWPYISKITHTGVQLGFWVTTASAGSVRVIIFEGNSQGYPETFLYQTPDINVGFTGPRTASGISFTFQKNKLYFVGLWTQSTPSVRYASPDVHTHLGHGVSPLTNLCTLTRTLTWGESMVNWAYDPSQLSIAKPVQIYTVMA